MKNNNDLKIKTHYLFSCKFNDDNFDADTEEHAECADELMHQYPWNDIFNSWNMYLHKHCKSAEEVINFANLFYYYGGHEYYIPEPYKFAAYFYYMIDMDKYRMEAVTVLDSIITAILSRQGFILPHELPEYTPETDPNILKELALLKDNN